MRIEHQNETPVPCTVRTKTGKTCKNVAQHIILRRGVKVSPLTNLKGHCHTCCNTHLRQAESEMS